MNGELIACTGSPQEAPVVDLSENLVAHYLLNNNSDDVSVNDNNGTAGGGVVFTGSEAVFDGSSYISSTSVSMSSGFAYSVWVSPDSVTSSSYTYILDFYDGRGILATSLSNPATTNLSFYDGNQWHTTNHTLSSGEYSHVYLSCGDGVVNIFVNGSQIYSEASNVPSLSNIVIGADNTASYYHFDGLLSNVRLYDSSNSNQSFVDALYNEGYHPRGNDIQSSEVDDTTLRGLTPPTTDGLVAHYPLTGTAEDATGNYNGTENGNIYVDDTERGSVASFDGVNDYIRSSVQYSSNFSVSFSIKPNVLPATSRPFNGSNKYFRIDISDGGGSSGSYLTLMTYDGTTIKYTPSINPISTDNWTYVTLVYSNNVIHYYINNVSQGSQNTILTTLNANTYIGSFKGTVNYFNGKVSNVRIYNRALTTTEISDIYTYEKNLRHIPIDNGLIAYYPLAINSQDNYCNQYDGVDNGVTYDGDCAVFDGSDYIDMETDYTATSGAVSIWFEGNTIGDTVQYLGSVGLSETDSDVMSIFGRINLDGKLTIYHASSGVTSMLVATTTVLLSNRIYHTVIQSNGSENEIYIDGVKETLILEYGSNTGSWISDLPSPNRTTVGALGRTTISNHFDGKISNVRIYNRALSEEEVKIIYNTEKTNLGA